MSTVGSHHFELVLLDAFGSRFSGAYQQMIHPLNPREKRFYGSFVGNVEGERRYLIPDLRSGVFQLLLRPSHDGDRGSCGMSGLGAG